MAHYAKVVDGKVTNVIVAEAEYFNTFVDDSPGEWIQTSYNTRGGKHFAPNSNTEDSGTPLRRNYAGIGMNYDGVGFYFDAPYSSWTLNSTTYFGSHPLRIQMMEKHISGTYLLQVGMKPLMQKINN